MIVTYYAGGKQQFGSKSHDLMSGITWKILRLNPDYHELELESWLTKVIFVLNWGFSWKLKKKKKKNKYILLAVNIVYLDSIENYKEYNYQQRSCSKLKWSLEIEWIF